MSKVIETAVEKLNQKLDGEGIDGSARFVIEDEGVVRIDENGASADDSEADCTMHASAETFQGILGGDVNPTAAFMNGSLRIEGDMGLAMKLGAILA